MGVRPCVSPLVCWPGPRTGTFISCQGWAPVTFGPTTSEHIKAAAFGQLGGLVFWVCGWCLWALMRMLVDLL